MNLARRATRWTSLRWSVVLLLGLGACGDVTGPLPEVGVFVRPLDFSPGGTLRIPEGSPYDTVLSVEAGYFDIAVHGRIEIFCTIGRVPTVTADSTELVFAWRATPPEDRDCPAIREALEYVAFIHGLVSNTDYHLRVVYDAVREGADSLKYAGNVWTGQRATVP